MSETNVTLFKPHKGQKRVLNEFVTANTPHKYGVVICGRQYGKSLLGQNALLYWLLSNNNSKGGWISPVYKQAQKVFKEMLRLSPIIREANKAELTITFVNGSTLQFLSSDRHDSIRGFSFHYLVVDEAADVKKEAMYEAILPTLTALGRKTLIISTPKGKNWLHEWYLKGNSNNDQYISFKGISEENPYADKDFIEECRLSYPPAVFKQEFMAEFTDEGAEVFKDLSGVLCLAGPTPPNPRQQYFAGIDVGLRNDFTVCTIMDKKGRVVDVYRETNKTYEQYGRDISMLLNQYKPRTTFVEVNGVGEGLFQQLSNIKGVKRWVTNNDNKSKGIQNIIYDIEKMELELPAKNWLPELGEEMSNFTHKTSPTGKMQFMAASGGHDDLVMSLMLANEARHKGATSSIYVGRG